MMKTELFVDSRGTQVEVHERNDDCATHGCCIHSPSPHPLMGAPLVWQMTGLFDPRPSHMLRLCVHGTGHPDFDSIEYMRRTGYEALANVLTSHLCCGCCLGINW